MTPAESRVLQVGDRVVFRGEPPISGKVTSNRKILIEVSWDDGAYSVMRHDQMVNVYRDDT